MSGDRQFSIVTPTMALDVRWMDYYPDADKWLADMARGDYTITETITGPATTTTVVPQSPQQRHP